MIAEAGPPREPDEAFRPVIGTMHAQKSLLHASVFVPAAHFPQLVAIVSSGALREVSFVTGPLFRRQAVIRSVAVSTSSENLVEDIDGEHTALG